MNIDGTKFTFRRGTRRDKRTGILVVPIVSEPALQIVTAVDRVCADAVSELLNSGAHGSEFGRIAHTTRGTGYRRVITVNLGRAEDLAPHRVRTAAGGVARWLINERAGEATVWVDGLLACNVEDAVGAWVGGMVQAGFRFRRHHRNGDAGPGRARLTLTAAESPRLKAAWRRVEEAEALAIAINTARGVAHEPGNILNPEGFATAAKELAATCGLKCNVHAVARLEKLGMGGLLAVGSGAQSPPCLVELVHKNAAQSRQTVALVGKAVTFDTGGYSLKTAAGMERFKFDKCGGVAVLGTLLAAAALELPCNLIGLIPVAENAVSEQAYRPGDIIRMMSGKSVEIISTDAEGRLILADTLTYAQQKHKPTQMIDLATLTGGVLVALGRQCAGLMSNDDTLAATLEEAGRRTHERLWRLPLWNDYRDLVRGSDADLKNSPGSRDAHAIAGGMFLKEFVDNSIPWAHLDISGVATVENAAGHNGRVATGFGVRLLIDHLRRQFA